VRPTALVLFGALIGSGSVALMTRRTPLPPPIEALAASPKADIAASAQGRVEGRGEAIPVEASIDGVLQRVLVTEGQRINAGDAIAEIACDEFEGQIRALEASLESATQSRVRIVRGSREEERRVAEQQVSAADAVMAQARRHLDRMQVLVSKDDVPRVAAEEAARDFATAEANRRAAAERLKLAMAGPLPEELARADADVRASEERLVSAKARRDKCVVRAPISGSVIRAYLKAGEAVSTVIPRPIVDIADLSTREIRVEVDERDIPLVHRGQKARIRVEDYNQVLNGTVTWTALVMGRKTARSTDPAEKADRDILEAVVSFDKSAPHLAIGLRVTVEFLPPR
jgi:HlyD family secretion protein